MTFLIYDLGIHATPKLPAKKKTLRQRYNQALSCQNVSWIWNYSFISEDTRNTQQDASDIRVEGSLNLSVIKSEDLSGGYVL